MEEKKRRGPSTLGAQINALFRKSLTMQSRQKKQLAGQIIFPLLMIVLLWILQALLVDPFVERTLGGKQPRNLSPFQEPTFAMFYGPQGDCPGFSSKPLPPVAGNPGLGQLVYVDKTAGAFANLTSFKSPLPDVAFGGITYTERGNSQEFCYKKPFLVDLNVARPVESEKKLDEQLFDSWDKADTTAGFIFNTVSANVVDVTVVYNSTLSLGADVPHLINWISTMVVRRFLSDNAALQSAFRNSLFFNESAQYFNQSNQANWGVSMTTSDMPTEEFEPSFDLISLIGPNFYVWIFQLTLPLILSAIVYEKEIRLREIMKMMGLKMTSYWTVTYFFSFGLAFAAIAGTWIAGAAFGFRFFTVNDGFIMFLFFILWTNVMVSFCFLLSVFFTRSHTATIVGYLLVFGFGLLASSFFGSFLDDPNTSVHIVNLFSIIPPFLLYRGLVSFGRAVTFGGTGVNWSNIGSDCIQLDTVLLMMFFEWVVFLFLSFYLEQTLPIGYGVKKHPLFCFGLKHADHSATSNAIADDGKDKCPPDVQAEKDKALSDDPYLLKIRHLRKVYPASNNNPPKIAVKDLCLTVTGGQCVGFLGPNGAGKTTSINMITGLFQPTSGTAVVNGLDIAHSMDEVHEVMGVCPQDNVLWGQLTGTEHLLFYGRIKNLKGAELQAAVEKGLKEVNLAEEATIHKRVSEYSGGMQRRLSVACALIGDPLIVMMDEPSTGLDPASRNQLWNVILKKKKECAMLLTTHAMEEADALCDRVAIFDAGGLSAIGTAAELKTRFPSFKLTVVVGPKANEDRMFEFVRKVCPSAKLVRHIARTSIFKMSKAGVRVSDVIAAFEENKKSYGITDWGISNTTLEEVFLRIVDGGSGLTDVVDEPEAAADESEFDPSYKQDSSLSDDD